MKELLTWGGLIASGGSIAAVIKLWLSVGEKLQKAEDAARQSQAALSAVATLNADLSSHKVMVAQEYVTLKAMEGVEERFSKAVDGLREEMRGMNQRLDQFLSLVLKGSK